MTAVWTATGAMWQASEGPNWGLILGLIGGGGVVGLLHLIFRVGAWKGEQSVKVGQLETDADKERTRIRQILDEIRGDIKAIFRRLGRAEALGTSPLRLTDYGRELLSGIGGEPWAVQLATELRDQVEGMEAYEIQEFAFAFVQNDLKPSEEQRAAMRRTAYEKAAQMEQIQRVLAIELRDRLLGYAGLEAPESPS